MQVGGRGGALPAVYNEGPGGAETAVFVGNVLQEAQHAARVVRHAVVGPRQEVKLMHLTRRHRAAT